MTPDEPFNEIALEPIDPTALRAAEGSTVWETVRGKRNRITIGRPQWMPLDGSVPLAVRDRIQHEYPPDAYTSAVLQLSLTLVPDKDCRFRSADFILTLDHGVFLHLEPAVESTTVTVAQKSPHGTFRIAVPTAGEVGLDGPRRDTEVVQTEASIEAFGINTPEAGWRLAVTRARSIPLDTTGLRSAIATPTGARVTVNVVAEIDVRTAADRWLTWAFKRDQATTALVFTLPG